MKITIVVPVYNLENYVMAIIESLKRQTDKNFEVIFVDDGSTDNTFLRIQDAIAELQMDCKIFTIQNSGVSVARNYGLSKAAGEYVLFVDGDDYLADDCIKEVRKHCGNGKTDIVCWGFDEVNEDYSVRHGYFSIYNAEMKQASGHEVLDAIFIAREMRIGTGSAAYKKSLLLENEILYAAGCSNGEDQEFTYKALSRAENVVFINKVLSFYLQRRNSISNSYDIRRFEVVYAFDRIYEYIEKDLSDSLKEAFETTYLQNYFYNLDSCLVNSRLRNIKKILGEVDEKYPELNKKVIAAMKKYRGKDKGLLVKIKLFLLSPFFYVFYRGAELKIENS